MKPFQFQLLIEGRGNTVKEAWENFNKNLEPIQTSTEGYNKYWRSVPELKEESFFDFDRKEYFVFAKIIITDNEFPGEFEYILGIPKFIIKESPFHMVGEI